ncbi:hypothetical protein HPP92_001919 [Vanilla planifolia]|uniref:Uncharacterized protein n=1 Tax=Vanilla planifolia TaxID=51239 RepID=A0A835VHE3_VANPL|nr:hypothetical protein HPP92_001919 [Vanilla planifolia]
MNIGRLRFFPLRRAKKAGDDDLALFRELFKRERETNKSLLEEASTEFEPFYGISVDVHKIPTAKKCDDLGNEIQKNEHDWLKTSPETPPFRPPEMDFAQPSNPGMVVQKELPLIPPLKPSRVKRKVPGPLKFTSSHRETPFPNSDSDSDSNPDQPSLPRLDRAPRFVNKEFSSTIESVKEAMFVNSHENRQVKSRYFVI